MAVEVGSAYVTILPSAKGFASKMQGEIGPELGRAGKSGGDSFGKGMLSTAKGHGASFAKGIGLGLMGGIGVAVAGFAAIIKTGIGETLDASAGTAQLAAGIKSTGNAAGVSVKGLNDLAGSIQGMSGQTDDSIVASEKLLLTFTNIKNSGTNKIFDQATLASADMAAKMGGSASDSAIQLGKALNDPIKGVGALSRVGVSFTAAQKKSIEAMVKSGDVAGAQSIILKELNTEFGGAAKAAGESLPGQMEKAKRSFEDVSQSVVTTLLPMVLPGLTKVGDVITKTVMPAVAGFVQGLTDGTGPGGTFRDILSGIWDAVKPVGAFFMDTLVPGVKALVAAFQAGGSDVTSGGFAGGMERIGLAARVVADFFMQKVVPAVMAIVDAIRGFIAVALPIVQAFVSGMMARITPMLPTIRGIFATIGTNITAALGLIQAVISAVTTAIAYVWNRWGTDIMNFAATIFGGILNVIKAALAIVQGVIKTVTSLIKGDWSGAWNGVLTILRGVWDLIKSVIAQALNIIKGVLSAAWALIKIAAAAVWAAILAALSAVWNVIKGAAVAYFNAISAVITAVWNGIKAAAAAIWALIGGALTTAWNALKGVASTAFNAIKAAIDVVWTAIKTAIGVVWGGISTTFSTVLGGVQKVFQTAVDAIGRIWDGLQELAKIPIRFVVNTVFAGIAGAFNKVASLVGMSMTVPHVSFASGGVATGGVRGKDSIPAMLMPNEYVVRSDGSNLVDAMSHYGVPGFADGGLVGGLLSPVKSFIDGILSKIPGAGSIVEFAKKVPGKLFEAIVKKVTDVIGSLFSASANPTAGAMAGQGVQRWAPLVLQALSMLGQPASLLQTTLRRMQQESGGNPSIYNTTDINAQNGTPSGGLMQVIGPTFAAYRSPLLPNNLLDPLANIVASMRYAIANYGSLAAAYNRAGGYDSGGMLPPGLSMVRNGTGRPEPVLSPGQWDKLTQQQGDGATSADIAALGDRIDATMHSITRLQQTMQRQMVGAR